MAITKLLVFESSASQLQALEREPVTKVPG